MEAMAKSVKAEAEAMVVREAVAVEEAVAMGLPPPLMAATCPRMMEEQVAKVTTVAIQMAVAAAVEEACLQMEAAVVVILPQTVEALVAAPVAPPLLMAEAVATPPLMAVAVAVLGSELSPHLVVTPRVRRVTVSKYGTGCGCMTI